MGIEKTEGRRGIGFWLGAGFGLIVAFILAALGLLLAWWGFRLMSLGGSWYYLLAGLGLMASGVLLALRRPLGGLVFAATLAGTFVWSLWEAGLAFWLLLPRLFGPAVIGVLVFLALLALRRDPRRRLALLGTGGGVLASFVVLGVALGGTFSAGQARKPVPQTVQVAQPTGADADWRYYGRNPDGARFAPFTQINGQNIGQLKEAWRFRTGEPPQSGNEDQTTPSFIAGTLYVCTPTNVVIAIDPDTGKEKWRHDPGIKGAFWNRCRGVGYHEAAAPAPTRAPAAGSPAAASPPATQALCARRIISTTIDGRMFALDAATGARCPGFGTNGEISLREGMGEIKNNFYFPTSAPTVAGDLVIVGGWVWDNRELKEPSGVVRAFSARTGALVWAWDLGNPAITRLPPAGQTYTRGTPNVWSTPSFDPALGLVYLPVGNATPDYWAAHRSDVADQYSSSVVAIEAATGKERWKYQTTHHDVWDYDVPAQPMLIDFPDGRGRTNPAIVVFTKRGQIFVLDRRTGAPLVETVERRTPQDAAPGEWLSPTQPYPVGMPAVTAGQVTERMMWGATPIDQLYCRIRFHEVRYEGDFTPPGTTPTLLFPGNGGGQNWGSGAYDASRGLIITTGLRRPILITLTKSTKEGVQLSLAPNRSAKGANAVPYDTKVEEFVGPDLPMLPPTGVPCLAPPNTQMVAIDVKTRKIVWEIPVGGAEYSGPFGWRSGLKIPIGTFGIGGVMTTGAGLVFHTNTQDPYARAYDTGTGRMVWQSRLPVPAGGTPMTFISPASGRQFVVLTAGGSATEKGDYVIAYALPQTH